MKRFDWEEMKDVEIVFFTSRNLSLRQTDWREMYFHSNKCFSPRKVGKSVAEEFKFVAFSIESILNEEKEREKDPRGEFRGKDSLAKEGKVI
jgi:hypothetical protein